MPRADLVEALTEHERAWRERPVVRAIYREWYRLIAERLSSVDGPTVELGSGIGRLAEVVPHVVTTDVEPTPWTDRVADAEALPFGDASLANVVAVDVFHHLARPARFLSEAARTLRPGGRIVLLEPYCSPLSTLAYRWFHHERIDLSAPPLAEDEAVAASPLEGNTALPTLAFFRHREVFMREQPELRIVERRLLSFVLYPLSGGFSRPSLVPRALFRLLSLLDRALAPLGRLAAFRCLIVLERQASSTTPQSPSR